MRRWWRREEGRCRDSTRLARGRRGDHGPTGPAFAQMRACGSWTSARQRTCRRRHGATYGTPPRTNPTTTKTTSSSSSTTSTERPTSQRVRVTARWRDRYERPQHDGVPERLWWLNRQPWKWRPDAAQQLPHAAPAAPARCAEAWRGWCRWRWSSCASWGSSSCRAPRAWR